ncbi:hypothetical protein Tco_0913367 [Tanacetum coccineum]
MGSVRKSIAERAQYKREHDSRVNERQMQMHEEKVDIGKALDDGLVVKESSGTESGKIQYISQGLNSVRRGGITKLHALAAMARPLRF